MALYMVVNTAKFPDNTTKIACTLSYMTEGTASTWAQAFFKEKNETGTFAPGTRTSSLDMLNATFKDVNLQKKAAETPLREKRDIDKEGHKRFFTKYKILARDANLTTGTLTNCNNLIKVMLYDLQDRVSVVDPPPGSYDRYK